jgi:predicted neuraminidase
MQQSANAAACEFTEVLHPRADDPGLVEAFLPTACVQNHAANLCVLPGGDLGCVWFGGTQEGMSDISVWFSRLKSGATRWSEAVKLSHDRDRSEQNPILFVAPDGRLWLLYTAQRFGNQDTAIVRCRTSSDGGRTWSDIATLIDRPGTFVRQPPIVTDDGVWLLPVFYCRAVPGEKWDGSNDVSAVLRSDDGGKSWQEYVVPGSLGCVHMNIVRLADRTLLALFRSRWADNIQASRSTDGGRSWSAPVPTVLPNNNSSIQATALADGAVALVFNDASAAQATERRASLYDEIDDSDAVGEPQGAVAPKTDARKAFWGAPRAPMTIAISRDGGVTWPHKRNLEVGDGFCMTNNSEGKLNRELSYPSVIQDGAGVIHVAYTYFRQRIKYVRLAEAWITG